MRFFTVYGPYGRPDMALFKFADAISKSKALNVFNNGDMIRDFTYIDDVVNSIRFTQTFSKIFMCEISNQKFAVV